MSSIWVDGAAFGCREASPRVCPSVCLLRPMAIIHPISRNKSSLMSPRASSLRQSSDMTSTSSMLMQRGPTAALTLSDGPYPVSTDSVYGDCGYPATHAAASAGAMVPAGPGIAGGPSLPVYFHHHRQGQDYDAPTLCSSSGGYSPQGGYYPQMHEAQLRQQPSDYYGCGELTPMGHQQQFDPYQGIGSLNHCATNAAHQLNGLGYVDSVGECSPEGSVPSPSPHRGSLNLCSKTTTDPNNTPVIYPWMKMVHTNQGIQCH